MDIQTLALEKKGFIKEVLGDEEVLYFVLMNLHQDSPQRHLVLSGSKLLLKQITDRHRG